MGVGRRRFHISMILAAAAVTPALGQSAAPATESASGATQGAASIPDFCGIWGHPSLPGFELPASGPGPVVNKSRRRQVDADGRPVPAASGVLVSDNRQSVGDYTNPILKPQRRKSSRGTAKCR
jgi:hypothetical protein